MAISSKGEGRARPGPPPDLPTDEERAKFPELQQRARQAVALGLENKLLLEAAGLIGEAQAKIEEAMTIRAGRKVAPARPGVARRADC